MATAIEDQVSQLTVSFLPPSLPPELTTAGRMRSSLDALYWLVGWHLEAEQSARNGSRTTVDPATRARVALSNYCPQVSSTIGDDVEKQGIFDRHTMDDKVIVTQFSPGGCHPCVTAIVGIYAEHERPSIFCPVKLEMEEDQRFANMMKGSGTGFFNLSWTRVESGSE
jgi:hypothetical protein